MTRGHVVAASAHKDSGVFLEDLRCAARYRTDSRWPGISSLPCNVTDELVPAVEPWAAAPRS